MLAACSIARRLSTPLKSKREIALDIVGDASATTKSLTRTAAKSVADEKTLHRFYERYANPEAKPKASVVRIQGAITVDNEGNSFYTFRFLCIIHHDRNFKSFEAANIAREDRKNCHEKTA